MGKIDTKIFSEVPNELTTIEIDVEKNIFNVNGVPFGDKFSGFNISCKAGDTQAESAVISHTAEKISLSGFSC